MKLKDNLVICFATGLYIGKIPLAPGTFGTLWGLPLCFLLTKIDGFWAVLTVAIFIALAVWVSHRAQNLMQLNDPGCIVIDEIAGMMVTLLGIPFQLLPVALGFFIFRGLDIVKPFPIDLLEKKVPGGAGVVLDDVLAGVYGNLILRAAYLIKEFF